MLARSSCSAGAGGAPACKRSGGSSLANTTAPCSSAVVRGPHSNRSLRALTGMCERETTRIAKDARFDNEYPRNSSLDALEHERPRVLTRVRKRSASASYSRGRAPAHSSATVIGLSDWLRMRTRNRGSVVTRADVAERLVLPNSQGRLRRHRRCDNA